MTWRTAIGLKPTRSDLAQDLLKAADRHGLTGWQHDAAADSLRNGDNVISLTNMHLEYAAAARDQRRTLLQKYFGLLQDTPVSKLWSLAQTKIYPLLRSRYERVAIEIDNRRKNDPAPPRAGRPFLSHLDQILGYDHGPTVSQVTSGTLNEWGVTLESAIDRATANLRALPSPKWHPVAVGVWQLDSPAGYSESFLQLPRVCERLPAKGTPLAMIPNRGVLLATGTDEADGLTTLLAEARKSFQENPWPLCGDLFKVGSNGIQLFVPTGPDAKALAYIQRLDIESVYAAQKTALEAHIEAIEDVAFVATYGLLGEKDDPNHLQSWSSWAQGVPTLLPKTDLLALGGEIDGMRKTTTVSWEDAAAIVGHYFKPTDDDPPRIRVDEFPNADELAELQKHAV